ncbi:MAG TPA: DsbA family protein, partial [Solirubrobacteraceae bacterium]|nr:DsbA family protein [Solirubrobacteraceae bacterium]
MAEVVITEYTDPGCPWAYAAEPFRRRLSWLYGDSIEWQVRMVVLAESPDDPLERGHTPEREAQAFARI